MLISNVAKKSNNKVQVLHMSQMFRLQTFLSAPTHQQVILFLFFLFKVSCQVDISSDMVFFQRSTPIPDNWNYKLEASKMYKCRFLDWTLTHTGQKKPKPKPKLEGLLKMSLKGEW